MTTTYQHVYLSPHYDDAALSCGGAIHRQTQAGETVLVITICAAPPLADKHFSAFAQEMHRIWGNPDDVVVTRQVEDKTAMEILGANYLRLDITDCIYRGNPEKEDWYYNNNDQLFGTIHPADLSMAKKIIAAIVEQVAYGAETTIYAPLTVGHHVDHQLTHTAAWQLHRRGWQIAFYEDYPYVDPSVEFGGSNLAETLARLQQANKNLHPLLQTFSEANLHAKLNSIRAYASQIDMLFGSQAQMETQVQNYAWQVGQGEPAERIWIPQ
jgi:LmbE family N-acetylglucosaminyl deacetylase